RKFIDLVISQLDAQYLFDLIQYQKVLAQRNALLKYFAANRTVDKETLGIYNEQLVALGEPIFEKRKKLLSDFIPIFNKHHHAITDSAETARLVYQSDLSENNFQKLLERNFDRDRLLQYSSVGIHKDDLNFEID